MSDPYDRRTVTFELPPSGELAHTRKPIEILSLADLERAVRETVGPVESVAVSTCVDGSIMWSAIVPGAWPLAGTITVNLTTDGRRVYAKAVAVVEVGQDQIASVEPHE